MADDPVREDIAFIRQTLEEGRNYARLRSPDFAVWGALVTLGYLGVYGRNIGLWSPDLNLIWWPLVVLGWLFSTRSFVKRREVRQKPGPQARALGALWLGLGITLMLLGAMQTVVDVHFGWMDLMVFSLLAVCFFATAAIIGVAWLRWIAAGWWMAAVVAFLFRDTAEMALVGAGFMFALLCLPGLVLWLRAPSAPHD